MAGLRPPPVIAAQDPAVDDNTRAWQRSFQFGANEMGALYKREVKRTTESTGRASDRKPLTGPSL